MFSEADIHAKAWLARETVDLVLQNVNAVDKIFLIGSYVNGKPTEYSDLDFLVQMKKKLQYPNWKQQQEVHTRLLASRVHCIFGTEEAQQSLKKAYKEIPLPGGSDVTHSASA
jgi:predicted nucleotidyltransferase